MMSLPRMKDLMGPRHTTTWEIIIIMMQCKNKTWPFFSDDFEVKEARHTETISPGQVSAATSIVAHTSAALFKRAKRFWRVELKWVDLPRLVWYFFFTSVHWFCFRTIARPEVLLLVGLRDLTWCDCLSFRSHEKSFFGCEVLRSGPQCCGEEELKKLPPRRTLVERGTTCRSLFLRSDPQSLKTDLFERSQRQNSCTQRTNLLLLL